MNCLLATLTITFQNKIRNLVPFSTSLTTSAEALKFKMRPPTQVGHTLKSRTLIYLATLQGYFFIRSINFPLISLLLSSFLTQVSMASLRIKLFCSPFHRILGHFESKKGQNILVILSKWLKFSMYIKTPSYETMSDRYQIWGPIVYLLKADLCQDVNEGFAFSKCLNGIFP